MTVDLTVNGMNVLMSFVLALGLGPYEGMGFAGIAAGTLVAQYAGLAVAAGLMLVRYRRNTMSELSFSDLKDVFKGSETRRFFVMNADLFVRSLCFIAIYIGFTVISARYGDTLLAVSSILMKLLMIFSYFTDGFAYAGEALVGRYIGAGDRAMYKESVKWTFIWSMSIALIFMGIYHFAGVPMLEMMTSDASVVDASREYLPWLLLMPIVGCAAFTWDGIYIGATASRQMRNSMLWAVVAFVAVWSAGLLLLNYVPSLFSSDASLYNNIAMHILMAAYFAHLLARTVYLTARSKCCFPKQVTNC
jgi:MATE family multidrug resistance protein